MSYIKLNGVEFDAKVAISAYNRNFNVLDGDNAGRVMSGRMVRDIIGTYIGHKITVFRRGSNQAGLDEFWDYLVAHSVDESVQLEAADGQTVLSYEAYYTSASQDLEKVEAGVNYWGRNSSELHPHGGTDRAIAWEGLMANKSKILYDGRVFPVWTSRAGKCTLPRLCCPLLWRQTHFSPVIKSDDRTLVEFKRNTPMIYFYNDRQKGVFYVQDIQRTGPDLYQFSATSAIGLLSDGQHYGGIYTGQTVSELLPGLCGTVPYAVKSNLEGIKLYGWLPVSSPRTTWPKCSLQLGRQSKTIWTACFESRLYGTGSAETWAVDGCIRGPSVKYGSKVTQVIVTEHQYVDGGDEKKAI